MFCGTEIEHRLGRRRLLFEYLVEERRRFFRAGVLLLGQTWEVFSDRNLLELFDLLRVLLAMLALARIPTTTPGPRFLQCGALKNRGPRPPRLLLKASWRAAFSRRETGVFTAR